MPLVQPENAAFASIKCLQIQSVINSAIHSGSGWAALIDAHHGTALADLVGVCASNRLGVSVWRVHHTDGLHGYHCRRVGVGTYSMDDRAK